MPGVLRELTIIILGNRLMAATIHDELASRLRTARARQQSFDAFLLSGGRSNPAVPASEAAVMRDALVASGVAPERIVLEEHSLDTIGNAYFSRLVVEQQDLPRRIELVTSCYHRERALFIFRQVFGPSFDVQASTCADFEDPDAAAGEVARLAQARAFFEGIAPGDMAAIRARMLERHALYRGATWF